MSREMTGRGPVGAEANLQRQQAELLQTQRQMLERQNQQNQVLLPFLADQEGFDVTVGPNGAITSITQQSDPLREQSREIQERLNQRTLDALEGNLPVDPALESGLEDKETEIRERLQRQFGPGYETSTPGIETLDEFFESAEALRESARTNQLTLSEQLGLTRGQNDIFTRQSSQDVLRTAAVADPLAFAGGFGQVAGGYGQALVPYTQRRQLAAQQSAARADRDSRRSSSLISSGIQAAGTLGAAAFMFSDTEGKEVKAKITELTPEIGVYLYTRKDTGEDMIGVLSTEVEKTHPYAVYTKDGYDMVSYGSLR